jgi:hypothetical protein
MDVRSGAFLKGCNGPFRSRSPLRRLGAFVVPLAQTARLYGRPPKAVRRLLATCFHCPHFRPGFWIRSGSRAFVRISSRTLGRYVAMTNPAPPQCRFNGFQRIYVALQTTPEEPRQRNGPLGAPKRRPDPPQPVPHPPRLVCGGNHGAGTHWCPSGEGSPVAVARPPVSQAQSDHSGRTPAPPSPQRGKAVGTARTESLPPATGLVA